MDGHCKNDGSQFLLVLTSDVVVFKTMWTIVMNENVTALRTGRALYQVEHKVLDIKMVWAGSNGEVGPLASHLVLLLLFHQATPEQPCTQQISDKARWTSTRNANIQRNILQMTRGFSWKEEEEEEEEEEAFCKTLFLQSR